MSLKFGKLPATHDPRDLMLDTYLVPAKLPKIPDTFGHARLFGAKSWGMLGNDEYGDCAIAGPAHETMLWTKLGGKPATFTTMSVLSDYSAITGFNPRDPETDQGSNVRDVANYRRKTGMLDAAGNRHKIGAYIGLRPGHEAHVRAAAYLFDGVGIGFQVPSTAMDQFERHVPWTVVDGAQIVGGHYVPIFDVNTVGPVCVTWGQTQQMTWPFFAEYCDEAYAYLSTETLKLGVSPEGFKLADLKADLPAVGT